VKTKTKKVSGLRPPVKWHGGKWYQRAHIIQHFPDHEVYVESFGGGASILLNKTPSPREIYNDLDHRITRFFLVLQNHGDELLRKLRSTLYSAVEFEYAAEPSDDWVEQARRDFVRWRMSFGGQGRTFSSSNRSRNDMAGDVSGFRSAVDEVLPRVRERILNVGIECRPAIEVIRKYDGPTALHYVDPPYLHSTRRCRDVYGHEMTEFDHCELANVLHECRGAVVLSGYPSQLYDDLYRDWKTVTLDIVNHAAGGESKRRMTEVLWLKGC
jgi:DNA adenine methylase